MAMATVPGPGIVDSLASVSGWVLPLLRWLGSWPPVAWLIASVPSRGGGAGLSAVPC